MEEKNPLTKDITCSVCDFLIKPDAENCWFDHVAKAEHLFLRNIYWNDETKKMKLFGISDYKEIWIHLLNIYHHFQVALQDGISSDEVRGFISDKLNDMYDNFADLRIDIEKVTLPKKPLFLQNPIVIRKNSCIFIFKYD